MSDPKSPLERAWHGALLILGITIALSIAVWLFSQIWLILLIAAVVGALLYGGFLWLRDRRGRW